MEIGLRIVKPLNVVMSRQPCNYIHDKVLGYRYQPSSSSRMLRNLEINNLITINAAGFHDIEHSLQNGKIPVLVVGDSFTASLQVSVKQGWTQIVQQTIADAGFPNVEIINLGVDGYGTNQQVDLLRQVLPIYQPRLMVLAFYENDLVDVQRGLVYRECYHGYVIVYQNDEHRTGIIKLIDSYKPTPVLAWLFDKFLLARLLPFSENTKRLLTSNFVTPPVAGLNIINDPNNRSMDTLFQDLLALADENHLDWVIIPVPSRDNGPLISLNTLKANISAETFFKLKVVDATPTILEIVEQDGKTYPDLFWVRDGHFNIYGNQVYAQAIAKILITQYSKILNNSQ